MASKYANKYKNLSERLRRNSRQDSNGGLIWTGWKNDHGYGMLNYKGRCSFAHRLAWQEMYGPIPAGMQICHHCDVPLCINPSHLFVGTQGDNIADMVEKGRQRKGVQLHWWAKLTDKQIEAIRADSRFHRIVAAEHGVSRSLIGFIKQRKIWKHVQ